MPPVPPATTSTGIGLPCARSPPNVALGGPTRNDPTLLAVTVQVSVTPTRCDICPLMMLTCCCGLRDGGPAVMPGGNGSRTSAIELPLWPSDITTSCTMNCSPKPTRCELTAVLTSSARATELAANTARAAAAVNASLTCPPSRRACGLEWRGSWHLALASSGRAPTCRACDRPDSPTAAEAASAAAGRCRRPVGSPAWAHRHPAQRLAACPCPCPCPYRSVCRLFCRRLGPDPCRNQVGRRSRARRRRFLHPAAPRLSFCFPRPRCDEARSRGCTRRRGRCRRPRLRGRRASNATPCRTL